jgi:K+-transporting ATPase c subunit
MDFLCARIVLRRRPFIRFESRVVDAVDQVNRIGQGEHAERVPRWITLLRGESLRADWQLGAPLDQAPTLVEQQTTSRSLGILGEPHVKVLELNLAVAKAFPKK